MSDASVHLRLGTRGSLLARAQSKLVAGLLLSCHPNLRIETAIFSTSGDRIVDRPLADAGGKGLFTKELELALIGNEIDFAVHSYKDLPVTMPLVDSSDLTIAAVPVREDSRDLLILSSALRARFPALTHLSALPSDVRIGTSSLRRRCQILDACPNAQVEPLRGNIDTRLRKVAEGQVDATVLALAGLKRAGLFDPRVMTILDVDQMLPAAGQGALALQCRLADTRVGDILRFLHDESTAQCVAAERAVVAALEGDCYSPIASLATIEATQLYLRVAVGQRGGELPVRRAQVRDGVDDPDRIAKTAVKLLTSQNKVN